MRRFAIIGAALSALVTGMTFGRGGFMDPLRASPLPDPRLPPISPRFRRRGRGNARKGPSATFLRQIAREKAVGIDPIYLNGMPRGVREDLRSNWRAQAAVWDKAHPKVSHG